MKNIKIFIPKLYEYPFIISRFIFVTYVLIRNGLLTEINRLNLINKKYHRFFYVLKFIFEKKKLIANF